MFDKTNQTYENVARKSICQVGKETNQSKLFKVRVTVILNVWGDGGGK